MKDGFDYSQFKEYMTKFEDMTESFDTWLKTFLLQQAQRCIARTKTRQRALDLIDTGFMINAWTIGDEAKAIREGEDGKFTSDYNSAFANEASINSVKQVGNSLEITLGNIAEYASYVELGHTSRGGNWINGGFMFTISMDEIERAMPTRFQREFINFLKNWGIN